MASILRTVSTTEAPIGIPSSPSPRRRDAASDMKQRPTTADVRAKATPVPGPLTNESGSNDIEPIGLGNLANALISERLDASKDAEASAKLQQLRQQAEEQGYKAGMARGLQEGTSRIKTETQRLSGIAGALQQQWVSRMEEAENMLVEVAFASVTRILGDRLATRDGVVAVVRQVLIQVAEARRSVTVRLAPGDFELLGEEGRRLLSENGGAQIKLVADDRVKLGGCLLDTDHGGLDGRLEMQLERLKEALVDARNRRQI
jgi:flagellar assembly protein FliH